MTTTNRTPPEQADLFCDADDDRAARTRNSMLWAAYGDALGFISELVDDKGLKRRTKGEALDCLKPWPRKVGGRGGVNVVLPAGCWSDDTQLRMAVSRSMGTHGFDVETFARIELPVWPSYGLGGGRASKAAAKNLAANNALWYANIFSGWTNAGGNGAAMRIQPHVWASPDLGGEYLLDVIIDCVCTHGHPRAIVGACFHASTLAHALQIGAAPTFAECGSIAANLGNALSLIEGHQSLGTMWVGLWEQESGTKFREVWQDTVAELCDAVHRAATASNGNSSLADTYRAVSDELGLTDKRQQGSAILTTVAAAALAVLAGSPYEGTVAAANELGTDTDTIATMAGALLGACHATAYPPEDPIDANYLLNEADRLTAISKGRQVDSHSYPDTLTWIAPQTQADALAADNGQLVVEGLGPVKELDFPPSWTPRKDFAWQWVQADFGQTLLIKRRPELRSQKAGNSLAPPSAPSTDLRTRKPTKNNKRRGLIQTDEPNAPSTSIDGAINYARQHIDDDRALARALRQVAQYGTKEDLTNFAGALYEDLRRH